MQKKIGIAVGAAFVATIVGSAQPGGSVSDEVLRAVRTAGDAQIKRDKATLERFTADDFMYIHSSGSVSNSVGPEGSAPSMVSRRSLVTTPPEAENPPVLPPAAKTR